ASIDFLSSESRSLSLCGGVLLFFGPFSTFPLAARHHFAHADDVWTDRPTPRTTRLHLLVCRSVVTLGSVVLVGFVVLSVQCGWIPRRQSSNPAIFSVYSDPLAEKLRQRTLFPELPCFGPLCVAGPQEDDVRYSVVPS
uniref:Uncharacterized protein n=1 Tax=Caenorhabditis japonica TaxID=281687 RepID=A0A8R1EL97_CAEJA